MWNKGTYEGTWHKGNGRYRQEIVGPAIIRPSASGEDLLYYIRKRMCAPNSLGSAKCYDFGFFSPPEFMPDGTRLTPGMWTTSSTTQESSWNTWWEQGTIDERPVVNLLDDILGTAQETTEDALDYLHDYASSFTDSNNTERNLIIAAVAVLLVTVILTRLLK